MSHRLESVRSVSKDKSERKRFEIDTTQTKSNLNSARSNLHGRLVPAKDIRISADARDTSADISAGAGRGARLAHSDQFYEAFHSSLYNIFGMKLSPKLNRSNISIPEYMLDLYRQKKRLLHRSIAELNDTLPAFIDSNFGRRKRHSDMLMTNTIRSFYNEGGHVFTNNQNLI